jgi:hypothetical protein
VLVVFLRTVSFFAMFEFAHRISAAHARTVDELRARRQVGDEREKPAGRREQGETDQRREAGTQPSRGRHG